MDLLRQPLSRSKLTKTFIAMVYATLTLAWSCASAAILPGQCALVVATVPNVEELTATVAALPDPSAASTVYIMGNGELRVSAGLVSLQAASRMVQHRISQGLVPETTFCMHADEVVGERAVPVLARDDSAGRQNFDDETAQECSDLWMARNRLWIAQGQCPESRLARRTFPEAVCKSGMNHAQILTTPPTAHDQTRLQNLRARETYLGCSVDETFGRLYEAARGSVPLPGRSAIAATTSAGYVNVRAGPSTRGFKVLDRLEPETLVQVRSRVLNPSGTHRWIEIEYEDPDGQVRSGYVYFSNLEVRERRVNVVGQFEDFPAVLCERDATDRALNLDQIDLDQARETARIMRDTGPNFAGSAQLLTWGCGTGCAAAGILDHATGVWLELPFVITRDYESDEPLYDYRPDSTLLIARGLMNEYLDGPFQYHWTGYGLQILSDPRHSGDGRPTPAFEASLALAESAGDSHGALRAYRQAAALATSRTQRASALEGLGRTALTLNESVLAQAYAQPLLLANPRSQWLRQHRDLLARPEMCLSRPMSAEPVDLLGHVLSN